MQKVVVPIIAVLCLGFMGFIGYLFMSDSKKKLQPQVAAQNTLQPNQKRQQPPPNPGPKVGEQAPEISGEDVDGKAFKLSDYRGKVVVLDFWGFW